MQVAVRQSLLDYGTTVGLEILSSHIREIKIPHIETTIQVPLVGDVDLNISDITCLHFQEPRELASIKIDNSTFHASSRGIAANFSFKWSWESNNLPLSGAGDGSIEFDSGDVNIRFLVEDHSGLTLDVRDADIHFDDIEIKAHGALGWIYNAMLSLFHDSIVSKIEDRMNTALRKDVPRSVNSYLADLPSTVTIQGLPISAAFRYALYTHGFLLVRAFPVIGGPNDPSPAGSSPPTASTPTMPASSSVAPGERSATSAARQRAAQAHTDAADVHTLSDPRRSGRDRALPPVLHEIFAARSADHADAHAVSGYLSTSADADDRQIRDGGTRKDANPEETSHHSLESVENAELQRVAGVLLAAFEASWMSSAPAEELAKRLQLAGHSGGSGEGLLEGAQRCPASSTPLNATDADILADAHMATLFVNDAVPQCLLWALQQQGLLHYNVRDGEVPGIRLLTDVFSVLIPGIQQDYPHRSIALSINSTSEPHVEFVPGRGTSVSGSYETRVFVLPEGLDTHGARASAAFDGDDIVEVAVLEATLSAVADVQFTRSKVSDLKVNYTVRESPYKINPWTWEATIRYVLGQVQAKVGIHALWEKFVAHGAASRLHAQHAVTTYLPGWFQLSVDFRVDLD